MNNNFNNMDDLFNQLMGNTLSDDMKAIYQTAQKKGIPVFVTPDRGLARLFNDWHTDIYGQ